MMNLVSGSSSSSYMDCMVFFGDECFIFCRSGARLDQCSCIGAYVVGLIIFGRYFYNSTTFRMSTRRLPVILFIYNHTLPEYLISTLLYPRRIGYTDIHTDRENENLPQQPFLLSLVVMLITPPCYPSRIYHSIPTNLLNSNFGELDGRRLARLFCFILNFEFKFLLNFRRNIFIKYFCFHYLLILLRIQIEIANSY